MYDINDTILYGANGVCRVMEITHRDFGGQMQDYYVLKPVFGDQSTIFVPVKNEALTKKMRRVMTVEEINRIIEAMPFEDTEWVENENERKELFRGALTQGDPMGLVRIIKSLYEHQQEQQQHGRKLRASDERFFHDAEKMLYDEFALVLKIEPEEVLPLIIEKMQPAQEQPA